jgi:hypothetical protein
MRRRPLPTQLTTALDDVQASRAPEVTRVLRPGEARVSRAVGHTIGSCPRRWPSANARPILPSARAQPVPRPRAALPPKEPVPYVEPTADSCSRNRVPSVRHLLLNEARRRRSGPGTRPGGRRARAVGLSGIVGTAFGHACAVCEWNPALWRRQPRAFRRRSDELGIRCDRPYRAWRPGDGASVSPSMQRDTVRR